MKATDQTRTHEPAGGDPWPQFRAVQQAMERLLSSAAAGPRTTTRLSEARSAPRHQAEGKSPS